MTLPISAVRSSMKALSLATISFSARTSCIAEKLLGTSGRDTPAGPWPPRVGAPSVQQPARITASAHMSYQPIFDSSFIASVGCVFLGAASTTATRSLIAPCLGSVSVQSHDRSGALANDPFGRYPATQVAVLL